MKNILITGVSTGIGYHLTRVFLSRGFRVIGSVRKALDADKLSKEFGDKFHPLVFDVTDKSAIHQAVPVVEQVTENQGLDGLINNAGIAVGGPVTILETEDFRKQFEVNLFGIIEVTKAFLPLLGTDKKYGKTPGKIINIGSVSGKIGFPFLGPYCASKFALEGFSDVLRRELLMYGIDVIVIEPGPIKTPIWEKSMAVSDRAMSSDYGDALQKFVNHTRKSGSSGMEPEVLSEKIFQVFQKKNPRVRYVFHNKKFTNYSIPRHFLSARQFDKLIKKMFSWK